MRVYVSSTSEDLHEFRAGVVAQLDRMGHSVVSMEGFSADARSPVDKCLADVASAEVYIGLFAFRYGSIPEGYNASVTELEFREAGERGLARLIFLVPDDTDGWPIRYVDRTGEASARIHQLREELMAQDGFTVAFFNDRSELSTLVFQAITEHQSTSEADRDSSTTAATWREFAKPLSFDAEINRHLPQFTGREWVDAKLDDWIARRPDSRVFCLLGGPGIGKSAIACNWGHTRPDIAAFHHCVYGHKDKTDPKRILLSLAAQLAERLPAYERRLAAVAASELASAIAGDTRSVFDAFLLQPLGGHIAAPDHDHLVVIDGLDEAGRDHENELASFIGEVWAGLPRWLRLVVTAREELNVSDYLENLHPFILNARNPQNLDDVRSFLRNELRRASVPFSEHNVNEIVDKSEGLFLYAKVVLDEIREGRLSVDQTAEFPEGLTGYYIRWFDRQFPDRKVYQDELHRLVSAIVAQQAPLPLETLCGALGLSIHDLQQRLMVLGVLFPLRSGQDGDRDQTYITPMHKTLHDWLTEKNPATLRPRAGAFAADPELGNRLLADEGYRVYSEGALPRHGYFRQTLLSHLFEAGQTERFASVLLDPELVDSLWSGVLRHDWQRQINRVRHSLALSELVADWIETRAKSSSGTTHIAVVAGKLGRLFREIGAFDEVVQLAQAALDIWQANDVSDAPEMVDTLLALGAIQLQRDEIDRATNSYETALSIAQRLYDESSIEMADVLYDLCGFYLEGTREYEKAWEMVENSLAIYRQQDPPNCAGIGNCINDQAVILTRQGRSADYLGLYEEALAHFEEGYPDGHPEMVATLCNIGTELQKEGRSEEAITVLCRAVALSQKILLPRHEASVRAVTTLADQYLANGEYDRGLEVLRDHVDEMERYRGPDDDDTARARLRLGQRLLVSAHRSEEGGRRYCDEIRGQCGRIRGASQDTILELLFLAEGCGQAGESQLRETLLGMLRRILREYVATPRELPSERAVAACFAEVLAAVTTDEPLATIAPKIRDAWREAEPELKSDADRLARARRLVVAMISWAGRTGLTQSADVEQIRGAFDLITEMGPDNPDTLDHLASLTVSLHHRHHGSVSESLCARLFTTSERVLGADHVQTQAYLENLAFLSMCRGKVEEAERLFRRALKSRLESGGREQRNTLSALSNVTQCLALRGESGSAQRMVRDYLEELPEHEGFQSARRVLSRMLSSSGMQLKNEFSAFDAARVCYELSLEIDPRYAQTHNNLAMLAWGCLDDPLVARAHFEKSLELEPGDGITHGNYALLLTQSLNDPAGAEPHFEKAMSLNPGAEGIPANFATMLILQGRMGKAWSLARRSMRLCMPNPDRLMLRPLFCAASILLLSGEEAEVPLGQIRTLFSRGIHHVPWVIDALLAHLGDQVPESAALMRAVSAAIDSEDRFEDLESDSVWQSIELVPLDEAWPDPTLA